MAEWERITEEEVVATGRLLTSTEAARRMGVHAGSVRRWANEGLLRCITTPGGHRRFDLLDLPIHSPQEEP